MQENTTNHLEHFGVKGMHWGVWNDETRARKLGLGGKGHKGKTSSNLNVGPQSKNDFYSKCVSVGYSKRQARQLANGRETLKKIAIGTLAVAGVAAAGVIGYQMMARYGTRTIKAGQILQTVHRSSQAIESRTSGPFYATFKKADNAIYDSPLFNPLGKTGGKSVVSRIAAKQNIKIASEARAQKTFEKLFAENPIVGTQVKSYKTVYQGGNWKMVPVESPVYFKDCVKAMGIDEKAKLTKETYRKFNANLAFRNKDHARKAGDAFYAQLKKDGYGAVLDSHDALGKEGFSRRPVIVFGDVKYDIASQRYKDAIPAREQKIKLAKAISAISTRQIMLKPVQQHETIMALGASGAATTALLGVQSQQVNARQRFIDNYKKEHPGTKKSNTELRKMYEQQQV